MGAERKGSCVSTMQVRMSRAAQKQQIWQQDHAPAVPIAPAYTHRHRPHLKDGWRISLHHKPLITHAQYAAVLPGSFIGDAAVHRQSAAAEASGVDRFGAVWGFG